MKGSFTIENSLNSSYFVLLQQIVFKLFRKASLKGIIVKKLFYNKKISKWN